MLSSLRKLIERAVIGESLPGLVRWGKHLPRPVIQALQRDSFRELVRYAAQRQKFLKRKLRENGIEPGRVRHPEDLGNIFTTPEDLRVGVCGPLRGRGDVGKRGAAGRPGSLRLRCGILDQ